MIQPAFFEFLSGIVELTTEINDKIFPTGAVPTGTQLSYLTWVIVDNDHVHHQGGPSGLANPRIQVDVWASTEFEAARIFDIVRRNLDGFIGTMGTGGNATTVRVVVIDSDREEYNPPDDATQMGVHRASGDFLIWFVEGV